MADESLSWGVLGENGRGVTEHYNLPVSAIDVIIGSLAASLGSVGGFCVGKCVTTLQLPLPMRPSPTTALPLQPRGHRPPAPCWCWVLFLGVCASVPVCYCQVGVATHDGVFPVLDLQLTLPSLTRLCCMPAEALDDAAEARAAAVRRGSAHSPLQGPLLCGIPDAPRTPGRARRCLTSRAGCHLGQHRTRGTPPIVAALCDSRPVCLHFGPAPPDCSAWSAACWCRVLCTCRTRQPGPRPRCASTSLRPCRSLTLRTPSACCRRPPTL